MYASGKRPIALSIIPESNFTLGLKLGLGVTAILTSRCTLNDRRCHCTIPVVEDRCARDTVYGNHDHTYENVVREALDAFNDDEALTLCIEFISCFTVKGRSLVMYFDKKSQRSSMIFKSGNCLDYTMHWSALLCRYNDAIMGAITGLCNSPHKWPVTRKMIPFDDVIMVTIAQRHWCDDSPVTGEFPAQRGKCFHLMTSSWQAFRIHSSPWSDDCIK